MLKRLGWVVQAHAVNLHEGQGWRGCAQGSQGACLLDEASHCVFRGACLEGSVGHGRGREGRTARVLPQLPARTLWRGRGEGCRAEEDVLIDQSSCSQPADGQGRGCAQVSQGACLLGWACSPVCPPRACKHGSWATAFKAFTALPSASSPTAVNPMLSNACCRVFSLHPIEGYEPPMLSGHKDSLVSIFFTGGWRLQRCLL
jgi:hypothetical protein